MKTMTQDDGVALRVRRLREVLRERSGLWLARADVVEIGLACGLTMWTTRALLQQDKTEDERKRARKVLKKGGCAKYHRERIMVLLGVTELLGSNDNQHEDDGGSA